MTKVMTKKPLQAISLIILVLTIFLPILSAYEIQGNSVIEETDQYYFNITPHTRENSGYINVEILSKNYSGNAILTIGFGTNKITPLFTEYYDPHIVQVQHNYTCEHTLSFEGTTYSCTDENQTIKSSGEYKGTLDNTIWDYENVTKNYRFIASAYVKEEYSFSNKNKWYLGGEVPVNNTQVTKLRYYLRVPNSFKEQNIDTKYNLGFYPSNYAMNRTGFNHSIQDNNYYEIDPFLNLTTNVANLWEMENLSGLDSIGTKDFSQFTGVLEVAGILGNALNMTTSGMGWPANEWENDSFSGDWAYTMIFKPETSLINQRLLDIEDELRIFMLSTNELYVDTKGSSFKFNDSGNVLLSDNQWQMITIVYDSVAGNITAYINDTKVFNSEFTQPNPSSVSFGARIGSSQSGSQNCDCVIDETTFWNNTLSQNDISNLYNNGDFLTYPYGVQAPSKVIITQPSQDIVLNSTGVPVTFTYSPSIGGQPITYNVSLISYPFNYSVITNTTLNNFSVNITRTDIPIKNDYNISVVSINEFGNNVTISNYTINICSSFWEKTVTTCSNETLTQDIFYTDLNNCTIIYDLPSDNGTTKGCTIIPPPTPEDKRLLIIIFGVGALAFLILGITHLVGLLFPAAILTIMAGLLSDILGDENIKFIIIGVGIFILVLAIWKIWVNPKE